MNTRAPGHLRDHRHGKLGIYVKHAPGGTAGFAAKASGAPRSFLIWHVLFVSLPGNAVRPRLPAPGSEQVAGRGARPRLFRYHVAPILYI
jgi:hypothetical protein